MKTHEIIHPKYGLLERIQVETPPTADQAAELLQVACIRLNFPLPGAAPDYIVAPPQVNHEKKPRGQGDAVPLPPEAKARKD